LLKRHDYLLLNLVSVELWQYEAIDIVLNLMPNRVHVLSWH